MTTELDLKAFKIHLPDGDRKSFLIYGDFRNFFGVKYQADAVKKIKKSLKELNLKHQPTIYYDNPACGIQTKNPDTLFEIVQHLKRLDLEGSFLSLTKIEMYDLHEKLVSWKTPKPQKWKVGDIFSLKLRDKSFGFGQIIGSHPTVALFDYKFQNNNNISFKDLLDKKVVTILHVSPNYLRNWTWKIIDNAEPKTNKDLGPTGSDDYKIDQRSFSPNALTSVANYYWLKKCDWVNENDLKELIMIK